MAVLAINIQFISCFTTTFWSDLSCGNSNTRIPSHIIQSKLDAMTTMTLSKNLQSTRKHLLRGRNRIIILTWSFYCVETQSKLLVPKSTLLLWYCHHETVAAERFIMFHLRCLHCRGFFLMLSSKSNASQILSILQNWMLNWWLWKRQSEDWLFTIACIVPQALKHECCQGRLKLTHSHLVC